MAKPNHSHAHRSCGFLGTAPPCSSQYQLEGGLKIGDWNLVKVAYSHVWCLGWKHPNSWGRKSKASQASLSTLYGCPAWQLQSSSASLIVAQGSKGPCPKKGRERQGEVPLPFMTQSWRPQNVTSISLYLLKGKHSKEKVTRLYFLMNLLPCFKPLQLDSWAGMGWGGVWVLGSNDGELAGRAGFPWWSTLAHFCILVCGNPNHSALSNSKNN